MTDAESGMQETDDAPSSRPPPPQCAACGEPARYRCPACDTRSCSVSCIDRHKRNLPCSGKRAASTFHAIGEFDDRVVHRDYQFLEGVVRAVDGGKRRRRDVEPSEGTNRQGFLPPARHQLLQRARERQVLLELLPPGMQRQRENTSRYDHRRRRICWRVEVEFDVAGLRHCLPNVAESTTLREILCELTGLASDGTSDASTGCLGDSESQRHGAAATGASGSAGGAQGGAVGTGGHSLVPDRGQQAMLHHRLRAFAAAGEAQLAVFLPVPHCRANDARFYELPLSATLQDGLQGKGIIEYPTLHVAIRGADTTARFPLLPAAEAGADAIIR